MKSDRPARGIVPDAAMTPSTDSIPAAARRGSPREVLALAAPVVITQLSTTAMGVVDSAMVGRLGATPLAAVGFSSIWIWTLFSLLYGTASGVQTFVAQADGAGRPEHCGGWTWHGFYTVAPVALLFTAVLIPAAEPLVAALGPSTELQAAAVAYTTTRLMGEGAFAAAAVVTSFFRGVGDTRTPLYATLLANAVNVVLDYGLIFGRLGLPEWGVAGAGAATAVGSWVGAVTLYAAFRRHRLSQRFDTRPVFPDRTALARFFRTGAPIGGQWCIGMTSFACFTTVVARMGDASMAASQAFVMLLSMSFMQAVGISIAAATLVGRYVGARDYAAVDRSYRSSLAIGLLLSGFIATLFIAVPGPLLAIFTDDPGVVSLGRPLLAVGALFQIFDFLAIVSQGALRGAGDTRWPFAVETALGWGFFLPLAYLLGIVRGGGLTGAWIGGLIYVCALALLLMWRFRSGAWKRVAI